MKTLNLIAFEDNHISQFVLQKMIHRIGHICDKLYESADDLQNIVEATKPDIILMDISLNGIKTGLEAVIELRETTNTLVFFLSAHTDSKTVSTIDTIDNSKLIAKPYTMADIESAIAEYFD